MLPLRLTLFAVLLALATSASAQDYAGPKVNSGVFAQGLDQIVYKGVVGNALDAIPMDPTKRLGLQRTNAVVGNALLGRTLTVLAGLTNPVLLLGGVVWGVWAAANIKVAETVKNPRAYPGERDGAVAAQQRLILLLESSSVASDEITNREPATILASAAAAQESEASALSHPRVTKIWLPQSSTSLQR